MAVKLGAGLDTERVMVNIALDPGAPRQRDFLRVDLPVDPPANQELLSVDRTNDPAVLSDAETHALDIPVDDTVDLHIAFAIEITGYSQPFADNGRRARLAFAVLLIL
jgi:hypothetical protein